MIYYLKIALIMCVKLRFYRYFNYGNLLQSYAFKQVLLRYSEKINTIWSIPFVKYLLILGIEGIY